MRDTVLHLPISDMDVECMHYISVFLEGRRIFEFYAGITEGEPDYYVPLYLAGAAGKAVTLSCTEEDAPEALFRGVSAGGKIEERRDLYPDVYREEGRQQVHFSSRRGWLNDPNGLVFIDGKFHLSYQHNPFCPNHDSVNVSWGLAVSEDGVHYTEYPDAVRPFDTTHTIASGSAILDTDDLLGYGPDTVIAAYTDYWCQGYRGRTTYPVRGQLTAYSTDGGFSFTPCADHPVIPIEPGTSWRDPKILRVKKGELCIAVYETYEGRNCVSFYTSENCRDWTFRSRSMDLFECPDLFPLPVMESGETLWVLYGAGGQYRVGTFEDFNFRELPGGGFLDYGDAVYAGQTWNSHPDETCRYHIAWIRDAAGETWHYNPAYNKGQAFRQSMTVQCRLTLHKAADGYRLYRVPTERFAELRKERIPADPAFAAFPDGNRTAELPLFVPGDAELTLTGEKAFACTVGEHGFTYMPEQRLLRFTGGKEYTLENGLPFSMRVVTDVRSVEFFIGKEISASYTDLSSEKCLTVTGKDVSVTGDVWKLESIWKE